MDDINKLFVRRVSQQAGQTSPGQWEHLTTAEETIALTPFSALIQTTSQDREKPKPPALKIVTTQFKGPSKIEGLKPDSAKLEFSPALLTVAAGELGRISNDLMQALAAGDFERIRETAQALKGVAASVGESRLVALASKLMRASGEQQWPALKRLRAELSEVAHTSITALLDIVAGLASHPLPGPKAAAGLGESGQEKLQDGEPEQTTKGTFTLAR